MQKAAYEAVTSTLNQEGDPAGALVALDDKGQIKAMMGGTDFAHNELNLATGSSGGGGGRQPGSTFKMFALATAVREGYSIRSVLPSPSRIEIDEPECTRGGNAWKVRGGPGGAMSLVSATKNSTNTVYAQLMVRMGPPNVLQTAKDMGVSAKLQPYCALVLGGGEVSVLDMAAGYSTLANQGVAKSPIAVTRVEFPDGTVKEYSPTQRQVLTPIQAGRVTYALQQVINGGTGKNAAFGRPAAGKTGTTQNNADAWFVGFTPKLTAAVWMGYPQALIPMDDVHGVKVQGGTFPAEMWRKFMQAATAGFDTGDFPTIPADELGAGETLDATYGKTSVVGGGGSTTPTSTPQTTQPQGTTSTTSPGSTTVPPSTTPPSTAPPTTLPATTVPLAKDDKGGGKQPK
jgi:penicillin-binding protein 1A